MTVLEYMCKENGIEVRDLIFNLKESRPGFFKNFLTNYRKILEGKDGTPGKFFLREELHRGAIALLAGNHRILTNSPFLLYSPYEELGDATKEKLEFALNKARELRKQQGQHLFVSQGSIWGKTTFRKNGYTEIITSERKHPQAKIFFPVKEFMRMRYDATEGHMYDFLVKKNCADLWSKDIRNISVQEMDSSMMELLRQQKGEKISTKKFCSVANLILIVLGLDHKHLRKSIDGTNNISRETSLYHNHLISWFVEEFGLPFYSLFCDIGEVSKGELDNVLSLVETALSSRRGLLNKIEKMKEKALEPKYKSDVRYVGVKSSITPKRPSAYVVPEYETFKFPEYDMGKVYSDYYARLQEPMEYKAEEEKTSFEKEVAMASSAIKSVSKKKAESAPEENQHTLRPILKEEEVAYREMLDACRRYVAVKVQSAVSKMDSPEEVLSVIKKLG